MTDWRRDRVGAALRGANPTVIARVPTGFAVMILGNTDSFLHAHVWPRYEWEPVELISRPVWLYPSSRWRDTETALRPQHDTLRASIQQHLRDLHSGCR